jgi:hypothetical protein
MFGMMKRWIDDEEVKPSGHCFCGQALVTISDVTVSYFRPISAS